MKVSPARAMEASGGKPDSVYAPESSDTRLGFCAQAFSDTNPPSRSDLENAQYRPASASFNFRARRFRIA